MTKVRAVVPNNRHVCHVARQLLRVTPLNSQQPRARGALEQLNRWVTEVEKDERMYASQGCTTGLLDACRACLDTVKEDNRDFIVRDRIGAAKDALAAVVRQYDQALESAKGPRKLTSWSAFNQ